MKTFYIDPITNDIVLDGSNSFKMVEGDEELIQRVILTITTNLGEWFLNVGYGFRRSVAQGKRRNLDEITEELYAAILQVNGVEIVEDVQINFKQKERTLSVDFTFRKSTGDLLRGVASV